MELNYTYPAFNNSTEEFGIAIGVPKFLTRTVLNSNSYLLESWTNSLKKENEVFFLSFNMALSLNQKALGIVSASTLVRLPLHDKPNFSTSPIVVYAKNSLGIVFLNYSDVTKFVVDSNFYFSSVDDNYICPPKLEDSQCYFFSIQKMVSKGPVDNPLQIIEKIDITHSFENITDKLYILNILNKEESFIPNATVTPAINFTKNRRREAETGITTGERSADSLGSLENYRLINSTSIDCQDSLVVSPQAPVYSNSPRLQVNEISKEPSKNKRSFKDVCISNDHDVTALNKISKISLPTIPGYISDAISFSSKRQKDSRSVQCLQDGKLLKSQKWDAMKSSMGWTLVWDKLTPSCIDVKELYVIPSILSKKRVELIQNLEFFAGDEFLYHLSLNPHITEEWRYLWPRLQDHGWEAIDLTNPNENYLNLLNNLNLDKNHKVAYVYLGSYKKLKSHELIPGLHVFLSKIALVKYISRFPYLLQTNSDLTETLERHGWKVFNSKFQAPQSKIEININEVRRQIWVRPTLMFQSYWSQFSEERLLQSLLPNPHEALELDYEPSSPSVDGMTRAQRDKKLSHIRNLCETFRSSNMLSDHEISELQDLLSDFGWKYCPAQWSNKWWKWEMVYTPPYSNPNIDERVFGKDFFFSVYDLIKLILIDEDSILLPPSKQVHSKNYQLTVPLKEDQCNNFDDERFTLEKRVFQLVSLFENPFETVNKFTEMLIDLGWLIFSISKSTIYIPPEKINEGVSRKNYKKYEPNIDYYLVQTDVIDHLNEIKRKLNEPTKEEHSFSDSNYNSDSEVSSIEVSPEIKMVLENSPISIQSKSTPSTNISPVAHPLLDVYSPDSLESLVICTLIKNKYFGLIFPTLKQLQWKTLYLKPDDISIIFAPWAIKHLENEKLITRKFYISTLSTLERGIDYFISEEDKVLLMDYILNYGFERKNTCSQVQETNNLFSSIENDREALIKHRSPYKPLFKASNPETHHDHLFESSFLGGSSTPLKSTDPISKADINKNIAISENTFSQQITQSATKIIDDMDIDEFAPLLLPYEDIPREARDPYILELLKYDSCSPLPITTRVEILVKSFERIFSHLRSNYKWSYDYITKKTTNVDIPRGLGSVTVYFRATFNKHVPGMIKGRDYFVSNSDVISYLVNLINGKASETNFKPFVEFENLMDIEEEEASIVVNPSKPVNKDKHESNFKSLGGEDLISTNDLPVGEYSDLSKLTLRDSIDLAIKALESNISGFQESFPVPFRESESLEILRFLLESLNKGRGGFLYACGNPGQGKTMTVESTIKYIHSLANISTEYTLNIVRANGALMIDKFHLIEKLYESLDPSTSLNADKKTEYISKLMTSNGIPFSIFSPLLPDIEQSISPKGKKVPMTILLINEFDMCSDKVKEMLLQWSLKSQESSLIVIATGNIVSHLGNNYISEVLHQVLFSSYTSDSLQQLLTPVKFLFTEFVQKSLASKVEKVYKSDSRKLFELAQLAISNAQKTCSLEDLDSYSSNKAIVTPKIFINLFPSLKSNTSQTIQSIPEGARNLLIALLLHQQNEDHLFTIFQARDYYNTYCQEKNSLFYSEDIAQISNLLNTLVTHVLVNKCKEYNDPMKDKYKLVIDAKTIIEMPGISELHKADLNRIL